MSRFVNLEFDGESERHPLPSKQASLKDGSYYLSEAATAFQNANFEAGLRHYAKVLEFEPNNTAAWAGQVRMLIELGEFQEAKLWADKALEHFPNDAELLAAKAVALGRTGDLKGAMLFSDAAVEQRGDTAYVWLARADVLLARKEKRAEASFERAMMLASGDWFVMWLAARIRSYYEQFAHALKLLQQADEQKADHFVLWLEMGECQAALGLLTPARNSFNVARQLNPDCRDITGKLNSLSDAGLGRRFRGWLHRTFRR
jgi:tetratricopeptide (TPR) repeat protein